MPADQLAAHTPVCPERLGSCRSCKGTFKFKQLAQHEPLCPERSVQCELCRESVVARRLDGHALGECKMRRAQCSYCAQVMTC